jgi:predicted enzyme related to lactoylglutathione lyase
MNDNTGAESRSGRASHVREQGIRRQVMNLASMRIITDDVEKLASFYELISGLKAVRYTPVFAELRTPTFALAIGGTPTLALFNAEEVMAPAQNRTVIIEFRVDDVDREFQRLSKHIGEFVQEPTLMPWGNRSILFKDPDGNLVNFFTPVTAEAIQRAKG